MGSTGHDHALQDHSTRCACLRRIAAARHLRGALRQLPGRPAARGFPGPDATTGNFDLKAVEAWQDRCSGLSGAIVAGMAKDAGAVVAERLAASAIGKIQVPTAFERGAGVSDSRPSACRPWASRRPCPADPTGPTPGGSRRNGTPAGRWREQAASRRRNTSGPEARSALPSTVFAPRRHGRRTRRAGHARTGSAAGAISRRSSATSRRAR